MDRVIRKDLLCLSQPQRMVVCRATGWPRVREGLSGKSSVQARRFGWNTRGDMGTRALPELRLLPRPAVFPLLPW